MPNDLLYNFFGVANEQRALRSQLPIEIGAGDGRPSPLLRDRGDGAGVSRKEVISSLLRRWRDVAQGVYADSESIGRVSEPLAGLPVEINKWPEAPRFTAAHCAHQRKTK